MHHLRLTVTNIEESRSFYAPLLSFMGFELSQQSDERLAWAAAAPAGSHQYVILTLAGPQHLSDRADRMRPGLHHFAFAAESRAQVDQLYSVMSDAGVEIECPPAVYHYQPGYYALYMRDPDNIKLEFVHVP